MTKIILQVIDLKVSFYSEAGIVKAVDEVSFDVYKGETLGIVGESGCGKSVTSMSILRLVTEPPGKIEKGSILFEDADILKISDGEMRKIRGNRISMIFQEPMTALNPVFTVGQQIIEVLILHKNISKTQARTESIELLKRVGIPRAERVIDNYPFSLSGGMRQRVMIAMAISCNPDIIIADEPTTALDVTIQAQILDLMKKMQKETNTSILFITHDLGVIAEMADRVIVMYAGQIVEQADVITLFSKPLHPYTMGLLASKPSLASDNDRLSVIPGNVPNLLKRPSGCQFHPRCFYVKDKCKRDIQQLTMLDDGRQVRCWRYAEINKGIIGE